MDKDIRWIQRFQNFKKALEQLKEGLKIMEERELSNIEKQGVIQAFEYTHELGWKVLKDFLKSKGNVEIYGSKDATKEAFKLGIIEDGEVWMEMIKSRNLTSHTYDENTADEILMLIKNKYHNSFECLKKEMERLKEKERDK